MKTFDCVNMKQQGAQKIRDMTAHGSLFGGALDGVLP